jgi:tagaturonate epimerase
MTKDHMEMQLLSSRLNLSQRSLVSTRSAQFGLAQTNEGLKLAVLSLGKHEFINQFEGEISEYGDHTLKLCSINRHNAECLRSYLPWLKPRLLGLQTSAGMGDRMGIATPGHVRAVRAVDGKVAPIFAQQSIREMSRTGRSPQQVMDDATWGIFEEGWQAGVGADADHLKTIEDVDACFSAGFTLFTFDPGEHVDNSSLTAQGNLLEERIKSLPAYLHPEATGLLGQQLDIEGHKIFMSREVLTRAVLKYAKAIDYVIYLYDHLKKVAGYLPFEVEISMDETELPTSPAEHVYIASELKRLGINWVSFAPRFVGRFEKGVDYIGVLTAFEADVTIHAAIARQFGPYKLSLHSGSDKFSIYSIFMKATRGLAHLKTAGTSYLEALRTIAALDSCLIKEIYSFARERFGNDRLSYHISAELNNAPQPGEVKAWTDLFTQFDAREILHVTFGSVLTAKTSDGKLRFYDRIMTLLKENREAYFENLESHFQHHLLPFSK